MLQIVDMFVLIQKIGWTFSRCSEVKAVVMWKVFSELNEDIWWHSGLSRVFRAKSWENSQCPSEKTEEIRITDEDNTRLYFNKKISSKMNERRMSEKQQFGMSAIRVKAHGAHSGGCCDSPGSLALNVVSWTLPNRQKNPNDRGNSLGDLDTKVRILANLQRSLVRAAPLRRHMICLPSEGECQKPSQTLTCNRENASVRNNFHKQVQPQM